MRLYLGTYLLKLRTIQKKLNTAERNQKIVYSIPMRHKMLLFLALFSAHTLLMAHSVVPHHHHDTTQEAEQHHKHEHSGHRHGSEKSEGHKHTPHFIHSPEFGKQAVTSVFQLADVQPVCIDFSYITQLVFSLQQHTPSSLLCWRTDTPPPYHSFCPQAHALRGPPAFIS
jgi:hypothetical protein